MKEIITKSLRKRKNHVIVLFDGLDEEIKAELLEAIERVIRKNHSKLSHEFIDKTIPQFDL